jgi:putative membrane protein
MNRLNCKGLIKKATGVVGAATLTSLIGLPGLAQVNPRPSILNEAPYNNNATGATGELNPNPGVFNEAPYNGSTTPRQANPGAVQASPATTPAARPTSPTTLSAAPVSNLDQQFMIMAAQGNNAEIQTSQLALDRSESEEVRQFAQQMIQEHTLANQQLQQIASEYGASLPADPGPLNQAIAEQLAQLSGAEFDRAYMGAQTNAHLRTIALFQTQIQQGQEESLRQYATQLLPSIANHYEMASTMVQQYRADEPSRPIQ